MDGLIVVPDGNPMYTGADRDLILLELAYALLKDYTADLGGTSTSEQIVGSLDLDDEQVLYPLFLDLRKQLGDDDA